MHTTVLLLLYCDTVLCGWKKKYYGLGSCCTGKKAVEYTYSIRTVSEGIRRAL